MTGKRGMSWESTKVYDWKNYVVPARPSRTELDVMEGYIRKLKKTKKRVDVAILGSTVEFRSLCHKHKVNVTVIDFTRKHYEILSEQPMGHKDKEMFREDDWRRMSTGVRYDLILGDLILNVGSVKDINDILRNASRSLAEDGYCIIRTWVRRGDRRYDVDRVIREHRAKRPRVQFYTSCIMPLYMCFYDFGRDKADYKAMIAGLKVQRKKGAVTRGEYLHCYDRWRHEGSEFTIPMKERIEDLKSRYFKIVKIRYGKDCFKRWAPIYIMRKK